MRDEALPIVSIGMLVYNDSKFIAKAIESLLNQTYHNFELIISDDCSDDGSAMICQDYMKNDSRIKYSRTAKNIGISANMMHVLSMAVGEIFMWASDDDLWDPRFIEELIEPFLGRESNDLIMTFCPFLFIDENDMPIKKFSLRRADYSGKDAYERLKKLTIMWDDGAGYGLFKREKIIDVKFPRWWWINSKCPLNNIYPSLYYYLLKGQFKLVGENPLFYKRIKNRVTYHQPYERSYILSFLAGIVRKINLLYEISALIFNAGKLSVFIRIFPLLIYRIIRNISEEIESLFSVLIRHYRKKTNK